MVEIDRYQPAYRPVWDEFIANSKNGTFLFSRDYMEYHADRFTDHSLLFFEEDKLMAVLPANVNDGDLVSHAGLTYGGIVSNPKMTTGKIIALFEAMTSYLKAAGIGRVLYKAIPQIYHLMPAEEDLYALFLQQAQLVKRDVSSTIYMPHCHLPAKRLWGARKAKKAGVTIRESNDVDKFLEMVSDRLRDKYDLRPVHNAAEIKLLVSRFPKNIKLFGAYREGALVAGAIMYETQTVAHAQYLSSTAAGRRVRALDLLITTLLAEYYQEKRWFDFGISTEQGGARLNEDLIKHKEEFGAAAICYDTYQFVIS
jgi:hypothetical protein